MTMSAPDVDAQHIAALIDGRLPPDEREKVLAAIDASPHLREAYADALATLGAMTPAPTRAVDRRRFLPHLTPLHWLEVAAAAAVVIAITPTLIRRVSRGGVPDASSLIASLSVNDSVAANLFAQPIWGATRGDGESQLASTARAIRLGAAIASFEMRQARADSAAGASALEVAALLETFPGGSIAANAYRGLSTRVPADSEVDAAARLAEQLAGTRPVQLGAWLQGARFAASASDTTWFAGNVGQAISRSAITIDDRADTEMAAKQFEQVVTERPHNFTAIATASEELLRLLGTR